MNKMVHLDQIFYLVFTIIRQIRQIVLVLRKVEVGIGEAVSARAQNKMDICQLHSKSVGEQVHYRRFDAQLADDAGLEPVRQFVLK